MAALWVARVALLAMAVPRLRVFAPVGLLGQAVECLTAYGFQAVVEVHVTAEAAGVAEAEEAAETEQPIFALVTETVQEQEQEQEQWQEHEEGRRLQ